MTAPQLPGCSVRRVPALAQTHQTRQMHRLIAACLGILGLSGVSVSHATEVRVLTAGAFKPVLETLIPAYEERTRNVVVVVNDTVGALVRRIEAGEAFDVAVLTPEAVARLAKAGKVLPVVVPLARVGIGVAVGEGAPVPEVGTTAAFTQTLLAAHAVAFVDPASGGSSGIYLAQLFERLGIADRIMRKAVLVPGGLAAARIVSGEADLALHQISEILAVPGARLAGPIPAELQQYTVYVGAIGAAVRERDAAASFLQDLTGEGAAGVLKQKGMEPSKD
ncbi:MAG TPA: substrate-binding domain-containing protein [Acetobacteraceae bacterium]